MEVYSHQHTYYDFAQLIAGISEIRRNNIFGYTAFCLYGGFWMSVGTVEIVSLLTTNGVPYSNPKATQAMLFMVSIFTYMLWILTFKINKTICSLFFLLGTTCILLSFGVHNETVDRVGGYVGLATSLNAFWLAFAELVNDVIGEGKEELIPLGHWKTNQFKSSGGAHVPGRTHGARLSAHMPTAARYKRQDANEDIEEGVVASSPEH